jgi:HK97 family phage prohead protease
MTLDPATFERAVEIDAHRRLTEHEAAHAAAALLQDLPVDSAEAPFLTLADTEDGDPLAAAGQVRIGRCDDDAGRRKTAIAILCGPLENSRSDWPPRWPLSDEPTLGDEAALVELVKALGLTRAEYADLVQDALTLASSRPFERLTLAVSRALETHGQLDEIALRRLKAISEEKDMEHVLLKARTTVSTDQGTFTAVISTQTPDREADIVVAAGMVNALRAWNRPIPLAWNHRSDASDIFGSMDGQSAHEVNGEVVASGQVHIDSSVGAEAWRSFKSRAIGFSFGYLVPDGGATPRPGGGRHITALDVFEITATPTPMNNDTRVLNTKALDADLAHVRDEWRAQMTAALAAGSATKSVETLRQKADRVARDHAPIQVAEFPC